MLRQSYWQAWRKWESTKKEIETKATKAGVIWFVDEDEVVQHILEVISRDEIAMAVTYPEAKEHDNFKEVKEGRAIKRRRKDGPTSKHQVQALEEMRVKSSKSTAELLAGREVLRAGSTSLRASFTVTLLGDYQFFALFLFVCFLFVCWLCVGRFLLFLSGDWYSPFFSI